MEKLPRNLSGPLLAVSIVALLLFADAPNVSVSRVPATASVSQPSVSTVYQGLMDPRTCVPTQYASGLAVYQNQTCVIHTPTGIVPGVVVLSPVFPLPAGYPGITVKPPRK